MRLYLIRHGQSVWNVERRLQGQTPGVSLTEFGRAQAMATAERLAECVPAGCPVWSSDLERAAETAAIIARRLDSDIYLDERLREQHYGVLQGRLTCELNSEPTPEGLHVTEVGWGGGESVQQVYARVRSFLVWLTRDPAEQAIVVTHGDTLRISLTVIDQLNRGEPEPFPHRLVAWDIVGNGSITVKELVSMMTPPGRP